MPNPEDTPNVADEMDVDMSDSSDKTDDTATDTGKADTESQQDSVTPDKTDASPDGATASQENKEDPEYWKNQYGASSTEAKRLAAENKQLKEYQDQAEPVISILRENPDIFSQIQRKVSGEATTDTDDSWDADESKRIKQAVQEAVSPLMKEQERQAKQRVDRIVDTFRKENSIDDEKWRAIRDYLPTWTAVKNPPSLQEALKKTLYMVDAETVSAKSKEQGRSEAFAEMDAAQTANVPSGGTPSTTKPKSPVSNKQQEAAEAMGMDASEIYGE